MRPTGELVLKDHPKAQPLIDVIGRAHLCVKSLMIIVRYLIANHFRPSQCHHVRRERWLLIWILFPYLSCIRALFLCSVFEFQRDGAPEPTCPILPDPAFVHPVFHVPVPRPTGEGPPAENRDGNGNDRDDDGDLEIPDFQLEDDGLGEFPDLFGDPI
jgi:hypothetical protein